MDKSVVATHIRCRCHPLVCNTTWIVNKSETDAWSEVHRKQEIFDEFAALSCEFGLNWWHGQTCTRSRGRASRADLCLLHLLLKRHLSIHSTCIRIWKCGTLLRFCFTYILLLESHQADEHHMSCYRSWCKQKERVVSRWLFDQPIKDLDKATPVKGPLVKAYVLEDGWLESRALEEEEEKESIWASRLSHFLPFWQTFADGCEYDLF